MPSLHPLAKEDIPLLFTRFLGIQREDSDKDCTLYTCNILEALAKLLAENQEVREDLQKEARLIFYTKSAPDRLLNILDTHLKALLPQYYQPNGEMRSSHSIRTYHAQKVWELENALLLREIEQLKTKP